MKHLTILFFLFLSIQIGYSQNNTVGLLTYDESKTYDGFNLLYPHNQPNVYLLNNCGEVVHSWEGEADTKPGNTAYLLNDGRLVKTSRPSLVSEDRIWAGGGGATIEIRDWDNNLEWSYTLNDSLARLHHDIAVIEKENELSILAIAWELKNIDEVIQAGRDTSVLSANEMWPDYIFEIDPATDEIVWEWHAWDHLVQDFDPTKDNFGIVKDNPFKIDVNWDFSGTGNPDWMHSNAIDFDPINNQVLLCVPNFSEVWIIDHTTTTEEAAQSFGGFSNRGGDLMYRWGNPITYEAGDSTDQTLFYPHDAHFIDDFVDVFDPNWGKIAIFNNRVGDDYSTFNVFDPGFDMYEWSFAFNNGEFGPNQFIVDRQHPIDSTLMWSTGLSSVQYLPNQNYLVCVGRFGYTFEVTPDNEIVWEYRTPIRGGAQVEQGDTSLTINNNLTFRLNRFPTDFIGFENRDLSPKSWIELNPDTSFCDRLLPVFNVEDNIQLDIYPNPADDMISVQWEAGKYIELEVFNLLGRRVIPTMNLNGGRKYLDTSQWEKGIYFIRINQTLTRKLIIER